VMTCLHPGVTREQAQESTGWELRFAGGMETGDAPTESELRELRELVATA
jgi:glutaconate CoA-transferase, subunit B